MTRIAGRLTLAAALVMTGWMAGRAQTTEPDFVIEVETKGGALRETVVRCVQGCGLAFIERGLNPHSTPMPQFTFSCNHEPATMPPPEKCTSLRYGGWLRR
jgi:hypothetical protein